jgi:hypothetical protein
MRLGSVPEFGKSHKAQLRELQKLRGEITGRHEQKVRKSKAQRQDGQMNGQGTLTWADGRKYVGAFSKGNINGQGTMFATNGSTVSSGIWSDADAFFKVGVMFRDGDGLSKDYGMAYKWFSLAAVI